ncbi:MAG: hypothetical protein CMO81_03690 [Waddliaceae bacterium]|nr:hypothetical protein [Waddliaceae bacterium]
MGLSRRDTIIVAVLINAGLLTMLFATAMNSDHDRVSSPAEAYQDLALNEELVEEVKAEVTEKGAEDEIDQMLQEMADRAAKEKERELLAKKEKAKAEETKKEAPKNTFAYKVQSGDSLDKISRKHGVSIRDINEVNDLQSSALRIGQVLNIPETPQAKQKLEEMTKEIAEVDVEEQEFYTVGNGDSPWKIARKTGIALQKLLDINGLDADSARRLRPGDRLRIR